MAGELEATEVVERPWLERTAWHLRLQSVLWPIGGVLNLVVGVLNRNAAWIAGGIAVLASTLVLRYAARELRHGTQLAIVLAVALESTFVTALIVHAIHTWALSDAFPSVAWPLFILWLIAKDAQAAEGP
jgi:hypothetical protein